MHVKCKLLKNARCNWCMFIPSAKEVMFSSVLVCLLAGLCKNYQFSQNSAERWHMGLGRNHFVGNPDHVVLLGVSWGTAMLDMEYVYV